MTGSDLPEMAPMMRKQQGRFEAGHSAALKSEGLGVAVAETWRQQCCVIDQDL